MLTILILYSRQNGIEQLISCSDPCNLTSCNNFIRAGFYLYQPKLRWAGGGMLYWLMEF